MTGPVVQAGTIRHVSLTAPPDPWAGGTRPGVPRQLPLAIKDFTGRADHIAALDALLPAEDGSAPGAVVISAVEGTAGIGKTTLAVWWAHRVQDRFPDGTLHVNLRGYGTGDPATPGEVLEGFLRALGMRAEQIPVGVEAQAGLFRSLVAGRRMLIVLDNANDAGQVRPLLPGTPGCVVVVTSRDSLTGLVVTEAATRLTLDLLPQDEAVELVTGILGPATAAAEPDAVRALVRCCGRLPLALRIAASQVTPPHVTVGDVVAELADDHLRLDALSRDGDDRAAVRAVFGWSYRRLPAGHARAFRRLGLHPGEEFGVEAAAAVTGLDLPEAKRVLAALARAHVIESAAGRQRYRFHDLLRAFAVDRAERDDPPSKVEQARRALLTWYAHHARAALGILFPAHRDWAPAVRPATRTRPEIRLAEPEETWAWTVLEVDNLVAATRDADLHEETSLTLLLGETTAMILHRRGRWDDLCDLRSRALVAARRTGDASAEIHAVIALGETYQVLGRWQDADGVLRTALVMAREFGKPWYEATALMQLGDGSWMQGRYAEAKDYLLAALPFAPGAQHGRIEAQIESVLAAIAFRQGETAVALDRAHRGFVLSEQAGDCEGQVGNLRAMATIHHSAGNHQRAIELCEQALRIVSSEFFPTFFADTLDTLGDVLRDTGDTARALDCWREALRIYDDCRSTESANLRARIRALEATAGTAPG
ncbi:TPR repeat-containing protein [Amycolatopsis vancoresmycina DSM 44592]|uniref:TPR repeat-containing protein n=1 Tax=Amycolatopsis vancoresmycina DSM 44592 TaxID=1292037 RepID=R1H4T2_9PSEU|nr:TPR repeat-containing protein [Amycolatopsis vancoresmycina DSM 44592]